MTIPVRLSRVHYPVTVLGFGRRIGIWFQGCSIGCTGCVSRDTWDPDAGLASCVEDVLELCADYAARGSLDGITFSGGEPFEQPEALLALLTGLEQLLGPRREAVDLLCYSGYPEKRIRARHADILERLDALIPNPFVAGRSPGGRWRGSSNQPLVLLSALGEARYGGAPDSRPRRPEIQLVVDDQIWLIGVPRPGDMEAVEAKLKQQGIELVEPSWR